MWERIKRFFAGEVEDALGKLGARGIVFGTDLAKTAWAVVAPWVEEEAEVLRRGLPRLFIALGIWLAATLGAWLCNLFVWQKGWASTTIGLSSLLTLLFIYGYSARIFFLVAVGYGFTTYRISADRWVKLDIGVIHDDMRRGATSLMRGTLDGYFYTLRILSWIAIGETLFFIYGNIFPMWDNYTSIPLFFSSVLVFILLSKKEDTGEEKKGRMQQVQRVMFAIAVLCSMSFLNPQAFQKLGEKLTSLQTAMVSDTWLPITIALIIAIAIVAYGSKTLLKYTQWLLIGLPVLYIDYVVTMAVYLRYNTPLVPTVLVSAGALVLAWAGIGLMTPKGDGSGKRMALGSGLIGVTYAVVLLFFMPSQGEQYVDPVTGESLVYVATDPVTGTQVGVRGPKAALYTVDPNYGAQFIPWTSLTREEQDMFRLNEKWVDGVDMGGLNLVGSSSPGQSKYKIKRRGNP